jgi:hypothetical protein
MPDDTEKTDASPLIQSAGSPCLDFSEAWEKCSTLKLTENDIAVLKQKRELQEKADRCYLWWGWLPWASNKIEKYNREIESLTLKLSWVNDEMDNEKTDASPSIQATGSQLLEELLDTHSAMIRQRETAMTVEDIHRARLTSDKFEIQKIKMVSLLDNTELGQSDEQSKL